MVSSASSIASTVSSNILSATATVTYDGPNLTVMMKNIPGSYTREQLLEIVDAAGFQQDYDVVSLPIDLKTEELLGMAFINFTTHEQAEKFKAQFNGFSDWQVPCDNVCKVKWSDN